MASPGFGICFTNKLRNLGYGNYAAYIKSDHWARKREEYRRSDLPKACLVCGSPRYQLHHRTYTRLGDEALHDLLPLCGDCHSRVHKYSRDQGTHLQATKKILRVIFGWTRDEANRRFEPFDLADNRWVDRAALEEKKQARHQAHLDRLARQRTLRSERARVKAGLRPNS